MTKGRNMDDTLRKEMLAAFLSIEQQDAHVATRREYQQEQVMPIVRQSVEEQRRRFGATGEPESIALTPRKQVRTRLVPDPSMTDAEFIHQKSREMERANAARTKPNLDIGKVRVDENAMSRIGALCFIRKREDHHERAAAEFKTLYEARYGGQAPALDPGRVQVDTSPIAHDSGMAHKIDRTVKLEMAMRAMDKLMLDRLVACLILGVSCEDQSDMLPSGHVNRRQSSRCVDETLEALDHLATIWGYRTRAA